MTTVVGTWQQSVNITLGQRVVIRRLNEGCGLIPIVFQKDRDQCTGGTRGTD